MVRVEVPGLRSFSPFPTEASVLHLLASTPGSAAKRVSKPGAADFAYAQPLLSMPSALKRSCVIVILGNGPATGGGWQAFVLQVELLLSAVDATRLGELLWAVLAAKWRWVGLLDEEAAASLAG